MVNFIDTCLNICACMVTATLEKSKDKFLKLLLTKSKILILSYCQRPILDMILILILKVSFITLFVEKNQTTDSLED